MCHNERRVSLAISREIGDLTSLLEQYRGRDTRTMFSLVTKVKEQVSFCFVNEMPILEKHARGRYISNHSFINPLFFEGG